MNIGICLRNAALPWLLGISAVSQAADPCAAFKWDVSREVALFTTAPAAAEAAEDAGSAPTLVAGRLYALTLKPQEAVRYAVPSTKKMLADGAFGGLLKFRVEQAGVYRVAIDAGFWLDVVHQGKALPAADFNGSTGCAGPRKVVVYELPAGTDLLLQLGAASSAQARLTVTPVATPTR